MGNRKRDEDSEGEEDVEHNAPESRVQSKKATTSKAAGEGKAQSKVRTTKKPKIGDVSDEPAGGAVKVLKNAEGEKYVELGKKKRAAVRSFKDQVFLDIREFYGADGDEKPGKKGISLAKEQWDVLKQSVGIIDSCFAEYGKK